MPTPVLILLIVVGVIVVPWMLIAVIPPLFRGIGWCFKGLFWLIAHIAKFIFATIADALRIVGAIIAGLVFVPFVLLNILIARWSAAAHFGRSLQREIGAGSAAAYRLVIGNPARLLLLGAMTEGIEQRLPEAIAQAPGSDKPNKATGTFPGYKVVGSLRAGGSGGRLFVAEPLPEKRAALSRAGVPIADQVVIKAFSVKDGATLDQIVRESRALEAARRLHLILDHELNSERFYYVTAYVPGENLSIVTQQLHARAGDAGLRGETLASALGYAHDLLATLDRYHVAGLWHKDIKPDNIIVHAGQAHLVDLGLVTPLASSMTLTTHGTEYFRDPEMVRMALRGVKVHEVDGVKFDIYGVGAVLYSVVENSFPAHGGLSQISKGCPEALRWIIRRSMTDLVHRYPSARAMLADLDFVARASDPFVLKPAELPSMREGDVAMPAPPVAEPSFATIPASYAASPIPPRPQPAPAANGGAWAPPSGAGGAPHAPPRAPDFAPPRPGFVRGGRPQIRVVDWWTGRYAAEAGMAPQAGDAPRNVAGQRAVDDAAQAAAWRGAPRVVSTKSAREQLASARERVARRQMAAMSRMGRRQSRFSAGPNMGVSLAVLALLLFVGAMVSRSIRASHQKAAELGAEAGSDGDSLRIPMRIVTPTGDWSVELRGDSEMLLVNEEEPIAQAVVTGPDGAEQDVEAAPAAFLPRLLAGPDGSGHVAFVWDRSSLNPESTATVRAVADLLEDGGATLVGYKDHKDDIDAAARVRSIIGVSSIDDPGIQSALKDWLIGSGMVSLVYVEREGPWVVLDVTGSGMTSAIDRATEVPMPKPRATPPAPLKPDVTVGPEI